MKTAEKYSIDILIDILEELEVLTRDYHILAKDIGEEPMSKTGIPKYMYDTEHCIKEKEQLMSLSEKMHMRTLEQINNQLPIIYMFVKERIAILTEARNELLEKYNKRKLAMTA